MKNKEFAVYLFLLPFLTLFACRMRDNPVDPGGINYQGFTTVATANEIEAATEDGAELVFQRFTVSEVLDAQAYRLEIATDEGFSNVVYTEDTFTSNIMESKASLTGDTYYWRGAAMKGGVWGKWTEGRGVKLWSGITSMSPADGSSTTDTTPEFSWNAVVGAAKYEVQIADTKAGVASASAITVTSATYTLPKTLSAGDRLYWRVRAIDGSVQYGKWSDIVVVVLVLRDGMYAYNGHYYELLVGLDNILFATGFSENTDISDLSNNNVAITSSSTFNNDEKNISEDSITLPHIENNPMSISMVVKGWTTSSNVFLVLFNASNGSGAIRSDGRCFKYGSIDNTPGYYQFHDLGTYDNLYHHIVIIYNSTEMKVYIDNVLRLTDTATSNNAFGIMNKIMTGLSGKILKQYFITDTELTEDQIAKLMTGKIVFSVK